MPAFHHQLCAERKKAGDEDWRRLLVPDAGSGGERSSQVQGWLGVRKQAKRVGGGAALIM